MTANRLSASNPSRPNSSTIVSKLHWSPRSPFVRKVMIVAHDLGLAGRIECVRTVAAMMKPHPELMRDNPLSKIPTLVLDDGTVLYDSSVICEYFDHLHDGPKLFPEPFAERMTALRRQALGDGWLDATAADLGRIVGGAAWAEGTVCGEAGSIGSGLTGGGR